LARDGGTRGDVWNAVEGRRERQKVWRKNFQVWSLQPLESQIKRRLQIHPELRRGREDHFPSRSAASGVIGLDSATRRSMRVRGTWIRLASAPALIAERSEKLLAQNLAGMYGRFDRKFHVVAPYGRGIRRSLID
jgi:hypothetical protein